MSTSPTKSSRIRLSSALRDGFKERGWSKKTLGFSRDLAPTGWVQAPLELLVSKEVDPGRYGGVSLFAVGVDLVLQRVGGDEAVTSRLS